MKTRHFISTKNITTTWSALKHGYQFMWCEWVWSNVLMSHSLPICLHRRFITSWPNFTFVKSIYIWIGYICNWDFSKMCYGLKHTHNLNTSKAKLSGNADRSCTLHWLSVSDMSCYILRNYWHGRLLCIFSFTLFNLLDS